MIVIRRQPAVYLPGSLEKDLLSKLELKINIHGEMCIWVMNAQLSQGRDVICFESSIEMLISAVLITMKAGNVSASTRPYFLVLLR